MYIISNVKVSRENLLIFVINVLSKLMELFKRKLPKQKLIIYLPI